MRHALRPTWGGAALVALALCPVVRPAFGQCTYTYGCLYGTIVAGADKSVCEQVGAGKTPPANQLLNLPSGPYRVDLQKTQQGGAAYGAVKSYSFPSAAFEFPALRSGTWEVTALRIPGFVTPEGVPVEVRNTWPTRNVQVCLAKIDPASAQPHAQRAELELSVGWVTERGGPLSPDDDDGGPVALALLVHLGEKDVAGAAVAVYGCCVEHKTQGGKSDEPQELGTGTTDTVGRVRIAPAQPPWQFSKLIIRVTAPGSVPQEASISREALAAGDEVDIGMQTTAPKGSAEELYRRPGVPTREDVYPTDLLTALPLPGTRSYDIFALLSPGIALAPIVNSRPGPGISPGLGSAGQFAVNGIRARENNFTSDGSDNNDEEVGVRRQGFLFLVPQSVESVEEFDVTTALADAQFGRNAGGQANTTTRSGGVEMHGSAYGFLTDRRVNARNFFDLKPNSLPAAIPEVAADGTAATLDGSAAMAHDPVTRPIPFTRAQAGFVLGGPTSAILKPGGAAGEARNFFLASFEHNQTNAGSQQNFAVPTVAQRGFAGTGFKGFRGTDGSALYPASVAGDAIFSLYPFPNNPAGPYGPNTFSEVLPASGSGNLLSLRFDRLFELRRKTQNFGARYNLADEASTLPATGAALDSSLRPLVRIQTLAAFLNSDLPRNAGNTFRFSYGASNYRFQEVRDPMLRPSAASPNEPFLLNAPLVLNVSRPGGPAGRFVTAASNPPEWTGLLSAMFPDAATLIAQGLTPATEAITGPLGQVNVAGFSPIGADVYHFPQTRTDRTTQLADSAVRTFGAHTLTLGMDFWYVQLNSMVNSNARPRADFWGQRVQPSNLPAGLPYAPSSETQNPFFSPTDRKSTRLNSSH